MEQTELLILALLGLAVALMAAALGVGISLGRRLSRLESQGAARQIAELRRELAEQQRALRQELAQSAERSASASASRQEARLTAFAMETEQKLSGIRATLEQRLQYLQEDNGRRLEEMRATVDQRLQKSLEDRLTQSFQLVNTRLAEVYKGLGEMQTLAAGVGDLKKILSNVKTRGILGEVQLGAILGEILSPEQYGTNVATRPGSRNVVEFAVKLPARDGETVWLPIDSKFPADAYTDLRDAYDSGDPQAAQAAASVFTGRLRAFAKDIRDKYIDPPNTTDFAILFLPTEGLYAEAVNRGMVEVLQRDYRVNLAGPSTMAALLNSLQMGFRAFAIQKRSGQVWQVLGAVKTEFDRFAQVLALTQQRLSQAGEELDKLVGVRTRQIQRQLRQVEGLREPDEDGGEDPAAPFSAAQRPPLP